MESWSWFYIQNLMNSAKLIDLLLFGGVLWNLQLRFQFFEEEDKVVQLNTGKTHTVDTPATVDSDSATMHNSERFCGTLASVDKHRRTVFIDSVSFACKINSETGCDWLAEWSVTSTPRKRTRGRNDTANGELSGGHWLAAHLLQTLGDRTCEC